jgi:hypothetical protein
MTFAWSTFATLAILASALHWLFARATITRGFWGAIWLPAQLDSLLKCPACSGFWIGLSLGAADFRPLVTGHWWVDVPVAGICAMWGVPVAEGVMLWGLDRSKIH